MPNSEYVVTMARYNCWQNESLLLAADDLSELERQKDRGSFFGSIQRTLSHIFWGDMVWMSKFELTPAPKGGIVESTNLIRNWRRFRIARQMLDKRILTWSHEVTPDWFEGDVSWYSGVMGCNVHRPKKTLVIHLFNHQTHHRGQVHAMMTAAGARPENTDVPFMPAPFLNM
ncbi:MAG: DinB family protein [Pseudomonadales bacterium]|jgi:uncharacterized damage-inducible protein DinB|tara:strand:- start:821 stop:1336 length:516 start_codon:yes stop_codon:yes gene_type:complete